MPRGAARKGEANTMDTQMVRPSPNPAVFVRLTVNYLEHVLARQRRLYCAFGAGQRYFHFPIPIGAGRRYFYLFTIDIGAGGRS
jgi:hypothetical protein